MFRTVRQATSDKRLLFTILLFLLIEYWYKWPFFLPPKKKKKQEASAPQRTKRLGKPGYKIIKKMGFFLVGGGPKSFELSTFWLGFRKTPAYKILLLYTTETAGSACLNIDLFRWSGDNGRGKAMGELSRRKRGNRGKGGEGQSTSASAAFRSLG